MIPEERFSSTPVRGALFNPWDRKENVSRHWGPIALQDPSQGLAVKLWQARIEQDSDEILLSSFGVPEYVWHTHSADVLEVSLAFDQNARPVVAFVDVNGDSWMRWFDPVPNDTVDYALDGVTPRVTLDDHRPFNGANSDVILGYVREGIVRYRQLRDRFTIEYTPTIGDGGPVAYADGLHHISMNARLRLEFVLSGGGGDSEWVLPEVVRYLCERANLPEDLLGLNALDWEQIVRGYLVTNEYPAHSAIASLSQVFFFDPMSANGRAQFVPRDKDVAATILEADMIAVPADDERDHDTRRDTISTPRILHLQYYDEVAGLNPSMQHSERVEGVRAQGEATIATTLTFSPDEAATVVARQHAVIAEQQRGELNFSVPDNFLRLTESDAVQVEVGGRMVRGIIAQIDVDDGEQRYKVLRDRRSAYTMRVAGIRQPKPTRPPSTIAGPTYIELLDIPILRDRDDMLGFYVAVGGALPSWPGAVVEMSLDGGANYDDLDVALSGAIMGELVAPLAAHPRWYPDRTHTLSVALFDETGALASTNLAGMMNRRNRALVGDEIIAFGDADDVQPGLWDLTTLLRGRRQTDAVAHAAGERFVLLDDVAFVPAELGWLGRTITLRATALGRPLDESTTIAVAFAGRAQQEPAPAWVSARRAGSSIVVQWRGIGRLGAGANVAMGQHVDGYNIRVTDGTTTQNYTPTEMARSQVIDVSGYSGPLTVGVAQNNAFTGLGPYLEVTIA